MGTNRITISIPRAVLPQPVQSSEIPSDTLYHWVLAKSPTIIIMTEPTPQNAEETEKLKSCEKKEQDPILVAYLDYHQLPQDFLLLASIRCIVALGEYTLAWPKDA